MSESLEDGYVVCLAKTKRKKKKKTKTKRKEQKRKWGQAISKKHLFYTF